MTVGLEVLASNPRFYRPSSHSYSAAVVERVRVRAWFVRVRRLMARYRIDGRLPPAVFELTRDTVGLRAGYRIDRLIATVRPTLGRHCDSSLEMIRRGRRRMAVAGRATRSSQCLTHQIAQRVSATLTEADVDLFLVDREAEHLVFGIYNAARRMAWDALQCLSTEDAWYIDWVRGTRRGTFALRSGSMPRSLKRATSWSVYRAWAAGEAVVGPEQAAVLTFWETGSSGKHEMIGVRGQSRFDARSDPTIEVVDGHAYPGRTAFPISAGLERFQGEIDAVYTWVDGSDACWRAAFDEWSQREGRDRADRDLVAGRYRDNDELRYSLRSLWFGCDWVRKIFVVTADQVPAWLRLDDRIEVVSHRELLPESCLPTFNSHAIEAVLHRIEGLSEHFLYFNDDVFVGRPLRPDQFFTSSGLPKVFLSDARVSGVDDDQQLAVDNAAMRGRRLLAQDFGRVASFKPQHAPFALRRSLLEEFTKRYADEVEATTHHRFRHPDDISVAASLAQSYAIASGQAVIDSMAAEYVHLESARLRWHLNRLRLGRGFDTFCINETEETSRDRARASACVAHFLAEYFPLSAPWERDRHDA